MALPLLASATSRLRVDADVTICSTTGWAHGVQTSGAKVLYVHNTARWLYQRDEYLANLPGAGALPAGAAGALVAEMGSPRGRVGGRRARELSGDAGPGA